MRFGHLIPGFCTFCSARSRSAGRGLALHPQDRGGRLCRLRHVPVLRIRSGQSVKFNLARNVALFSKDVELPLSPFLGIMAVAPPPEAKRVGSRAPGIFGGNLDFKKLTAGAPLYLPVFNDSALFVTGDYHAGIGVGYGVAEAVDETQVIYGKIPKSLFKTKTPYWSAP